MMSPEPHESRGDTEAPHQIDSCVAEILWFSGVVDIGCDNLSSRMLTLQFRSTLSRFQIGDRKMLLALYPTWKSGLKS